MGSIDPIALGRRLKTIDWGQEGTMISFDQFGTVKIPQQRSYTPAASNIGSSFCNWESIIQSTVLFFSPRSNNLTALASTIRPMCAPIGPNS